LIAHGLDKTIPLSDDTREYLLNQLSLTFPGGEKDRARGPGRSADDNEIRDRWIAGTVNLIHDRCELDVIRGSASRDKGINVSVCSVVAAVLPEFFGNKAPASERRVYDIYKKCKRQKTAYDVPKIIAQAHELGKLGLRAIELHNESLRKNSPKRSRK